MRMLLLAFALAIAGCASVDLPEPSNELAEYQRESVSLDAPVERDGPILETIQTDQGQLHCMTNAEFGHFEAYERACEANSEALSAAGRGVAYLEAENQALLAAGRAAEAEARLFREFAVVEANRCRLVTAGAGAAGGFLLLVLGIGAL